MEKSSKLKLVGLTLAGLSVLASGTAVATSLKLGGSAQSSYVWFDDDVSHPSRAMGYGHGNLSFDNGSNLTAADLYMRGTVDRWVYNLTVSHDFRDGRSVSSGDSQNFFANSRRNGPAVMDAWVGWDMWDPMVRMSLGRMNVSQGLENTGHRSAYTFISPAAGQRSFAVGRADGFNVEGNPTRWMGYQAGVFFHTTGNGAEGAAPGTGANIDTSSQVTVSSVGNHLGMGFARVFLQPYVQGCKVLHVGGTYSHVNTKGDVSVNAAPGGYFSNASAQLVRVSSANGVAVARTGGPNGTSRTDGYDVWGLEGLAVWGPFHAQAEYTDFSLELDHAAKLDLVKNNAGNHTGDIDAKGWYVQGSWLLTGESRSYDPVSGTLGKVNPRHAKWGAWELAARYDRVDLDRTVKVTGVTSGPVATSPCGDSNALTGIACTNGGRMKDWTVGVNWYPNRNVKLMANYTSAEGRYAKDAAGLGPNLTNPSYLATNDAKRTVDMFAFKGQVDF